MGRKAQFYIDLDALPIYNWRKFHEQKDINFLREVKGESTEEDERKAWYNLNDEYLEKFGNTSERTRYLADKKKLAVLLLEFVETGDMQKSMEADLLQAKLFKNTESINEITTTFIEVMGYVEKYYGFQINERTTSTEKYFTYLHSMRKTAGNG